MESTAHQLRPARYLLTTLGGTLLMAVLIALTLTVAGQPIWWRGFAAGSVAILASLLLSFAIILPLLHRTIQTQMFGLLVAGVFRAAMLGAIVLFAIKGGGYPQNATLAIAGLYYAAIICAEGLCLWLTFESQPTLRSTVQPTLQPTRDPA
jgi:hypothetical protein